MKILHTADWHLDSPLRGHDPARRSWLQTALLRIPDKIAELCRQENCDMMLISGDIFDRAYSRESYQAVYRALESVQVPVFISPGNHDYVSMTSPWVTEKWPANVTVFTREKLTKKQISGATVWGAAFLAPEAPSLLEGFRAEPEEGFAIGILHGDTTQAKSPYCPVTAGQIRESGLHYLALGHIHEAGALQVGDTLCAWPGCPMGTGYDETGEKGVRIVELGQTVTSRFVPLNTPRFYDLETTVADDPVAAVAKLLPAAGNQDFYRITLTGASEALDLSKLQNKFSHFPNLILRDQTVPPVDPWQAVGEDSFEGTYFTLLQENLHSGDSEQQRIAQLAAVISRQLLDGGEVKLP